MADFYSSYRSSSVYGGFYNASYTPISLMQHPVVRKNRQPIPAGPSSEEYGDFYSDPGLRTNIKEYMGGAWLKKGMSNERGGATEKGVVREERHGPTDAQAHQMAVLSDRMNMDRDRGRAYDDVRTDRWNTERQSYDLTNVREVAHQRPAAGVPTRYTQNLRLPAIPRAPQVQSASVTTQLSPRSDEARYSPAGLEPAQREPLRNRQFNPWQSEYRRFYDRSFPHRLPPLHT